MNRAKRWARIVGMLLLNSLIAAAFAVAIITLFFEAIEEPARPSPTLKYRDDCHRADV